MAFFDTTWYVNFGNGTSTGYYAVPQHAASTAYTAGQIVRQFTTPAVGNERCFVCIAAGTSAAATDATWVLTRGAKTTDGTVTWIECTGATSMNGDQANTQSWAQVKAIGSSVTIGQIIKRNSGASYQVCTLSTGNISATEPAFSDTPGATTVDGSATWTCLGLVGSFTNGGAPHARLANVFVGGWFASGNTVYVGDNHAETSVLSISITVTSALMARILCHNHSGSYPPATSDITTGATITTSAASSGITISGQGSCYFYGLAFVVLPSTSNIAIAPGAVGQVQNWYHFEACSFATTGTGGAQVQIGASSSAWNIVIFTNTIVKFGNVGGGLYTYFVQFIWQNTGPILAAGSLIPTTLFQFPVTSGRFNNITLTNLDLSQLTGSLFSNAANSSIGTLLVQDCKLNAAMTVTTPINSGMRVEYLRSDSAGTSYKSQRIAYEGIETTETTIVRSGGAKDPAGQVQSRRILTTVNAQWLRPYKAEPLAVWNSTVGVPVNVTVCGTTQATILPYTDELWMDVEYLADVSSTLGTIISGTKSNLLAGASPAALDSSVWAVPGVTYAVFNGIPSAGIVVSSDKLTVTHGTTNNGAGVSSLSTATIGKYYFEVAVTPTASLGLGVGVGNYWSGTFSDVTGNFANGVGVFLGPTCSIYTGGTNTGKNLGTIVTSGGILSIAIDLSARLVWIRLNGGLWNADATAVPLVSGGVAVPSGTYAPFVRFTNAGATDAFTANFGSSGFTYAVPAGFTPGWPSVSALRSETPAPLTTFYTLDGTPNNVTMSNGNLTMTRNNTAIGGVNSTSFDGPAVGNLGVIYYSEVTLLASVTNGNSFGFLDPYAIVTDPPNSSSGGSASKWGVLLGSSSSIIYKQGAQTTGIDLGPAAVGDVWGMAANLDTYQFWFRKIGGLWNNNGSADPATGVGGIQIYLRSPVAPYGAFAAGSNSTDVMKFNFGQDAFVGTPPLGPPTGGGGGGDGSLQWYAFKLFTTITPQLAGYIHVRVRAAKPSTTYYIDPQITLS